MNLRFGIAIATSAFSVVGYAQITNVSDATTTAAGELVKNITANHAYVNASDIHTGNFTQPASSSLIFLPVTVTGFGTVNGSSSASATSSYVSSIFSDSLSETADLSYTPASPLGDAHYEAETSGEADDSFQFTATANEIVLISDTFSGSSSFVVDMDHKGVQTQLLTNGESQATYALVQGQSHTMSASVTSSPEVFYNGSAYQLDKTGDFTGNLDLTASFQATPEPCTLAFCLGGASLFVRRRLRVSR